MLLVTAVVVGIELVMLLPQLLFYAARPADQPRKWYLILLVLLIVYNVCGGFFPDPDLLWLPMWLQVMLAYGSGFTVVAFFPAYFYRAFDLPSLRFHVKKGIWLFLILPFIGFFGIGYAVNGDLDFAVRYGIAIPLVYAVVLVWALYQGMKLKYKDRLVSKGDQLEVALVFFAVLPWSLMPVMAMLHVGQLTEVLVTNSGFVVITVVFWIRYVRELREEDALLGVLRQNPGAEGIFLQRCEKYKLSELEIQVAELVILGLTSKEIGEKLFISESAVNARLQKAYQKTGARTRLEFLNKLTR